MSTVQINDAAAALFGPDWSKPQLAEALEWDLRRVQRWCAGREPVHPRAWTRLLDLLRERRTRVDSVLEALEEVHEIQRQVECRN